jgi:hypothetical protein
MTFYVGLSLLSNEPGRRSAALSAEARRILGLLSGGGITEASLVREAGGRPYFTDRSGDFSISHSRRASAVSFMEAGCRTGCDIQHEDQRRDFRGVSRRFFHQAEQDYIAAGDSEEMRRRFYAVWALKESYLKLRGLSIADISGAPVFSPDSPPPANAPMAFFLGELGAAGGERYMAAAALESFPAREESGPFQYPAQPVLRWFSGETLPFTGGGPLKIGFQLL